MCIKRIAALLAAVLCLSLCSCSRNPSGTGGSYDSQAAAQLRAANHRYLTLWSWQIPSESDMADYAEQAVDCGFTAVDLGVQWSAFEPLKGHFDWSWLDLAVKTFADKGLSVSLQPLLWSKDLAWAEDLSFQENPDGIYEEEKIGSFVSFTDANTLSVVKNTLQHFALHASTYGERLVRWGVRLSVFGEFDYSVCEDLDYSLSSAIAFRSYLKERYETWEELNSAHGLGVSSWEDLDRISLSELVDVCPAEWRLYRQESLMGVMDLVCGVFRSVDATVPIVCCFGTVGNGMNNVYSGIADLWTVVSGGDFDVLSVSLGQDTDVGLILSLISSLTTKKISAEVDGAGVWEDGFGSVDAVSEQVKTCGAYGVFSLSTANFTLAQLKENRDFLKSFEGILSSSEPIAAADPTKGIFVLTGGLIRQDVAEGYDALYGDVWTTLSEDGRRRVRFLTDVQVTSRDVTLEGVTDLYCGGVSGDVPVSLSFGEVFVKNQVVLHGQMDFLLSDGTKLSDVLGGFSGIISSINSNLKERGK